MFDTMTFLSQTVQFEMELPIWVYRKVIILKYIGQCIQKEVRTQKLIFNRSEEKHLHTEYRSQERLN